MTRPLPCRAAKDLVDDLETDPDARREFAKLVRSALARADADADDASDAFFDQDGEELMERLARPVFIGRRPPGSLTTGGAAGLGDIAGKAFRAARNLLNLGTYYEMKGRAGDVGSTGVADLLADLRAANPDLRIHLAGHSFGARTVSAAARAGDTALPVASVSLLQAAFSHFSFADNWEPGKDGLFRSVLATQRVSGPIVVTHTRNDRAVGVAYAIASRVAGQVAQGVGDAGDKYGGLGRNGALKTPEATSGRLLPAGAAAYDLQPGACTTCSPTSSSATTATSPGPRSPTPCCRPLPSLRTRCLVTPPGSEATNGQPRASYPVTDRRSRRTKRGTDEHHRGCGHDQADRSRNARIHHSGEADRGAATERTTARALPSWRSDSTKSADT